MAGATSLEAVKRKIKFLQEQADVAEERAERLQQELLAEKKSREQVSMFTARPARRTFTHPPLFEWMHTEGFPPDADKQGERNTAPCNVPSQSAQLMVW